MLPLPTLSKQRFDGVEAYTDEQLFAATGVRIAFTTRHGGVSQGAYDSLNLGSHVEDNLDAVLENRTIVQRAFDCAESPLIVPKQVHGDTVLSVRSAQDAAAVQAQANEGADAIVVSTPGVAALLCFADCVPVIAVAPSGTFAVIHAGWRGVENLISAKAVRQLAQDEARHLGVSERDALSGMNLYIGPHIHPECFETSEEIRAGFQAKFGVGVAPDARHVNLAQCLRIQLQEAGIAPERIADVDICTVCDNEEFFSFRAQDGLAGRHGAFAVRTAR